MGKIKAKKKRAHRKAQRSWGRLYAADKRDRKFPMAAVSREVPTGRRIWKSSWLGDQGSTPHCVGYAWAHWLNSQPIRQFLDPHGVYAYAQHVDEWDGEDYDGTSVRAGAKVLQDLGCITSYRWGTTESDVIKAVLLVGPVVIGSAWYSGMMEADADGLIHPTGSVVGGHAWLIYGCDTRKRIFWLKNSWGPGWGDEGRAMLAFGDLGTLLAADGEACIGVERVPAPQNVA